MSANPALHSTARLPAPRVVIWLLASLIVAATLLAYRGSLAGPFVLDDTPGIVENQSIRNLATAWSPPADTTASGRPMVNLSLALNYAFGGLEVRGYHATNLAIHALAALVLFGIVRRTLQNPRVPAALARDANLVATGVALLWALHPLQTEAVTYTIQRAESLMGLFYLLTLYAFIRGTRGWQVVSFVACLLGMATKEVMVTAPLLVLLYDRTFVASNWREALRARRWFYAALASTWLVLALLVASTGGRGGTAGFGAKISTLDYALTQSGAIVHYLRLALWPAPLVFDYGHATAKDPLTVAAPALLLVALGGATLWALRARPAAGFLGAWFFAILAPSSSVVPVATQTIAEHRMYLSLAAVVTLLALAAHRSLGRRGALVAMGAVALGLAAQTSERNATYRDALALWTDTLAKAPDNPRAVANVGLVLLERGRTDEAVSHFAAAVARQPNHAPTRIHHANALLAAGRIDDAIAQLEAALQLEPASIDAENNLGLTLVQHGRVSDALVHFERAVRLAPQSAESRRNYGLALKQAGRAPEALAQFAAAARLRPDDALARDTYGLALLNAERLPEAVAEFQAALRLDPASAVAHNHLGLAHAMADQLAEALRQFERALALRPDFTEAAQNRDRARAQLSNQ